MLDNWRCVSVGVADLDEALAFWEETLGLKAVASNHGADRDLATLWSLEPQQITRQARVAAPGQTLGQLHLVEFATPGAAVREGAEVFDWCPKNLDVYASDLPARVVELKAAGRQFRSETYSEVNAPDGTCFREIHLPSHDAINVVLLEVLGESYPFSDQGFAGVGPLITIVGDAPAERAFVADALGMRLKTENLLKGPEVEKMVGLPSGATLDVSIWGADDEEFGQLEIIEYGGVRGADRYPLAVPPARGVLHVNYAVADLKPLIERLSTQGTAYDEAGPVQTLAGTGRVVTVHTPAGLRIDVFEDESEVSG
ncbi:MAG: hypothetical protein AAGA23_20045 [Pseudomonadota bacterium]